MATPSGPPKAAPSTATRPGLVGRAGMSSKVAERRRRPRAPGAASPRPGGGGVSSSSSRGALATPPAPPEAAPSTTPHPELVGRTERPSESAERRRHLRAPGATSPRPGGGRAASPSSRGALATPPALPGDRLVHSAASLARGTCGKGLRGGGAAASPPNPRGDLYTSGRQRGGVAIVPRRTGDAPAPPEAAPFTAPRPGLVRRAGRPSEAAASPSNPRGDLSTSGRRRSDIAIVPRQTGVAPRPP